ncbi:MAG: tRNA glutamyl-Q(34) synthetase GluQRS [Alphaproteobacteria bacterium]|nr:tRNA glutamyl-Q(34) synthetase GluQRS [Alphaproteobacteria bacterium]
MIVSRFAPSPTGHLHLGHALSALLAFDLARGQGGRFLLRIEDIDGSRCRPEFEAAIYDDLAWLGLEWERPVRRQSEHIADYARALDRLRAAGLAYPCFCSRKQIVDEIARSPSAPQGPDGPLYPGTCRQLGEPDRARRLAAGAAHCHRLDARRIAAGRQLGLVDNDRTIACDPDLLGDVVIARRDAPVSYHLAVTVDDALQGISHVVRGEDLLPSTHVHRLLQAALGLPTPEYRHHRLLTDAAGRRLSKRDGAESLRALRAAGADPDAIRRMVGL